MKKLLLLLLLIKINPHECCAQFYKDSTAYKISFYIGPMLTYGRNPQSSNNNLYPEFSVTTGTSIAFRISNEALFCTGLNYVANRLSIKAYEDNSYNAIGIKAVHINDQYFFGSLQIPVGCRFAVFKRKKYFLTLETSVAINLITTGGHTISYYDSLSYDKEIQFAVGGDGSSRSGQTFYICAAINFPSRKATFAIEPFWMTSHLRFNYEGGYDHYTYDFTLSSIGIRTKIIF